MTDRQCGSRIAIVDDNMELVRLLVKLLDLRGMQAYFTACDGDEAVQKFAKNSPKPDIMIMDYRMPAVNGLQTTREILQIKPYTKIIFLSVDAEIE